MKINAFFLRLGPEGIKEKRQKQRVFSFKELLFQRFKDELEELLEEQITEFRKMIAEGSISPHEAAEEVFRIFLAQERR